ncbi:MAG: hypothetical protein HYV09_35645 [Deltaproteobacteria bacterium]|nr:hypothetical protein [Deltaproteobacteria bacterium]
MRPLAVISLCVSCHAAPATPVATPTPVEKPTATSAPPVVASAAPPLPRDEAPLDVDREIADQCLWSADEATALCTFRRDRGWSAEHELAFVRASGKAEVVPMVKFTGDAFHEPPPSMVPAASRASLRARLLDKHYRAPNDDECKVLETEQGSVHASFPTFSAKLAIVDHGYGCPGGHCGEAEARWELVCAKPKAKPRTVLTVTGHSIAITHSGRVCLFDQRHVLVEAEIGGRNEEGYRGERGAVVVDLANECGKP